jgi:hypothetical protein
MLNANESNIAAPGGNTPAVPEWDLGAASGLSKNNTPAAAKEGGLIITAAGIPEFRIPGTAYSTIDKAITRNRDRPTFDWCLSRLYRCLRN